MAAVYDGVIPTKDLLPDLLAGQQQFLYPDECQRKIAQLNDLLDKIIVWEPAERLSLDDAMAHQFFEEKPK